MMKSTRSRCELSPIKSLVNRFNSDAIAFFLIIDRLTIQSKKLNIRRKTNSPCENARFNLCRVISLKTRRITNFRSQNIEYRVTKSNVGKHITRYP